MANLENNGSMDPFDEFEFKPLTEGLGFHKKALSLKDGLRQSGVLEDELQGVPMSMPKGMLDEAPKVGNKRYAFDDVLSALEKTPLSRSATKDLQFTDTLPREPLAQKAMDIEMPRPVQSPFPRPEEYNIPSSPTKEFKAKHTRKKEELPSVGTRRGAADSPLRTLVPATVSVSSAILDLIIVMAFTMVFLIALLMVTKVDFNLVLSNLDKDIMTQISLGVLFLTVMQMYAVISRSFFGRTLGEWTFDMQLGQDDEQQKESYPMKVVGRCLINTLTGLIILPTFSLLFGKDLAGSLSGVRLYQQNR